MRRILVLVLILAACGDSTGPADFGSPAAFAILAGNNQQDTVTAFLSDTLVAIVEDSAGNPVPNAVVSWVGDGAIFAAATGTNADGETRNIWRLGTQAGPQRMEARWVNPTTGEAHVLGAFEATAEPGATTLLEFTASGDTVFVGQRYEVASRVSATDGYGNAVPASRMSLLASAGLTLSGDSVLVTDEGEHTVTASSDGRSAQMDMLGLHDLRRTWSTAYTCRNIQTVGGKQVDSTRIAGVTTDVQYPHEHGQADERSGSVLFQFEGTRTRFYADSTIETHSESFHEFGYQSPGRITWKSPTSSITSVLDELDPLRYRGGSWCAFSDQGDEFVLQAQ